ncbi:flagellar biosynthetic protein FliO [Marinomonas ostreistagni]|uniref:Flagellar protein n=1 Tax=Marinomonas ostreistagni TaxID=359209 RepID=A0ABS0Z6G7_9GAMM|nr:flagellar biosynthetic protein FliO [Marinomonas ostreistagni]MBJ7549250.1 flagellar biosynthetic protein FliO [Marinomonas ostreistagni]
MGRLVLALAISFMSYSVQSEPFSGGVKLAEASSVWRLFFALAFLLVLIPAVIWGLKRLQGLQHKLSKSEIQIIASQSIGAKEKLLLVEVQGKRMLIGATASSITRLREFDSNGEQFAELMSEQLTNEK